MTAEFMFITFTLFIAGVVAVPIASKMGLGSVLGYLIAGIVVSPVLYWAGVDVVALQHFAEFGVVMMLFLIGLEMQPRAVWDMRARIFVMGGAQVVLTAAAVMGVKKSTEKFGDRFGMRFVLIEEDGQSRVERTKQFPR